MSKVGFIGTGIMGAPMAEHVLDGGHEVVAFDVGKVPRQPDSKRGCGCAVLQGRCRSIRHHYHHGALTRPMSLRFCLARTVLPRD